MTAPFGISEGLKALGLVRSALGLLNPPEVHSAFDRAWMAAARSTTLPVTPHDVAALAGRRGDNEHDDLTRIVLNNNELPTVAEVADILIARWRTVRANLAPSARNQFFSLAEDDVAPFAIVLAQKYHRELTTLATFGDESVLSAFDDSRNNDRERAYATARQSSLLGTARLWTALGVAGATAFKLASDRSLGSHSTPVQEISALVAPPGHGKSLAIHRAYQDSLEQSYKSHEEPVPVWVNDGEPLVDQINRARVLGSLDRGVRVFSDTGSASAAQQLVAEFLATRSAWSKSSLLLTSRTPLAEVPSTRIHGLSLPTATQLIQRISGLGGAGGIARAWPFPLREALANPTFAVLAGVSQVRDHNFRPQSVGELMASIVGGMLRADTLHATETLSQVAASILDRGSSTCPISEAGNSVLLGKLVSDGVLFQSGPSVGFAVGLVADWFASQALSRIVHIDDVLGDETRRNRWRYALTIAIASSPTDTALRLFCTVAGADPGLASLIVGEAVASGWPQVSSLPAPPTWQAKAHLRQSLGAWQSALGDLYRLVGPVDELGSPLPMEVENVGESLKVRTVVTERGIPIVERTSLFRPGYSPAWSAKAALECISSELRDIIAWRALPTDSHAALCEELWNAALRTQGFGELHARPISLGALDSSLHGLDRSAFINGVSNPAFVVGMLLDEISRLRESKAQRFAPPWPVGSRTSKGGGPWTTYSYEELRERVRSVFAAAMDIYNSLVDRWFARLRPRFQTAALLPAKLVLSLDRAESPDRTKPLAYPPRLTWYIEPTSDSTTTLEFRDTPVEWSMEFMTALAQRSIRLRPQAPNRTRIVSQQLRIFGSRPATDIAYSWLWDDLTQIGFVSGIFPSTEPGALPQLLAPAAVRLRGERALRTR